jgi:hypothetical protein
LKITVLNSYFLKVPAVSGMEFYDGNLWMISDNANELSICNQQGELIQVLHSSDLKINQLPKKDKADFEASTIIHYNKIPCLLVLGSGSTELNRNQAKLFALNSTLTLQFDLWPFYAQIRKELAIELKDWNIEALACFEERLFFFNRGTNTLFEVNQTVFFDFLEQRSNQLVCSNYQLNLGQLNGFNLGISGATVNELGIFYCTASAEDTNDWYNDGAIIGSVISTFNISELQTQMELRFEPFKVNETLLPIKLEAICQSNEKNRFFVASDNDGEVSKLYEILIERT